MTSPSSTLDWQLNVYSDIHRDHRQMNGCTDPPQARVTRMLMAVNSGNPQQQQVCVCVCNVCLCVCVCVPVQLHTLRSWRALRLEGFQMCSHAYSERSSERLKCDKKENK